MTKERPILFKAEMVLVILEGRKTQTRRLNGLEDANNYPGRTTGAGSLFKELGYQGLSKGYMIAKKYERDFNENPGLYHLIVGETEREINPIIVKCPYGAVGDRLWVRETWGTSPFTSANIAPRDLEWKENSVVYRADIAKGDSRQSHHYWRPSIFMMRWMSRITLEITGVRVERLNEISEGDAIAEGIESFAGCWRNYGDLSGAVFSGSLSARDSYKTLWERINGAGSWNENPWVWVIEFKAVTK